MYCLTNICYCCLKTRIKLINIDEVDDDYVTYKEKLSYCQLQTDHLPKEIPKNLCEKCCDDIKFIYNFRKTYVNRQIILRGYVMKLKDNNTNFHNVYSDISINVLNMDQFLLNSSDDLIKLNTSPSYLNNNDDEIVDITMENMDNSLDNINNDVLFDVDVKTINFNVNQLFIKYENIETDLVNVPSFVYEEDMYNEETGHSNQDLYNLLHETNQNKLKIEVQEDNNKNNEGNESNRGKNLQNEDNIVNSGDTSDNYTSSINNTCNKNIQNGEGILNEDYIHNEDSLNEESQNKESRTEESQNEDSRNEKDNQNKFIKNEEFARNEDNLNEDSPNEDIQNEDEGQKRHEGQNKEGQEIDETQNKEGQKIDETQNKDVQNEDGQTKDGQNKNSESKDGQNKYEDQKKYEGQNKDGQNEDECQNKEKGQIEESKNINKSQIEDNLNQESQIDDKTQNEASHNDLSQYENQNVENQKDVSQYNSQNEESQNEESQYKSQNEESQKDGSQYKSQNEEIKNEESQNEESQYKSQNEESQKDGSQYKSQNEEIKNEESQNEESQNDEIKNDGTKNDEIKNDETQSEDSEEDEPLNKIKAKLASNQNNPPKKFKILEITSDQTEINELTKKINGIKSIKENHPQYDNTTCTVCKMTFTDNEQMKYHHKLIHNTKPGIACDFCNESFINLNLVKKHELTHKKGPFRCKICRKHIFNKITLKRHVKNHAEHLRHQCSICGLNLSSKQRLLSHKKSHIRHLKSIHNYASNSIEHKDDTDKEKRNKVHRKIKKEVRHTSKKFEDDIDEEKNEVRKKIKKEILHAPKKFKDDTDEEEEYKDRKEIKKEILHTPKKLPEIGKTQENIKNPNTIPETKKILVPILKKRVGRPCKINKKTTLQKGIKNIESSAKSENQSSNKKTLGPTNQNRRVVKPYKRKKIVSKLKKEMIKNLASSENLVSHTKILQPIQKRKVGRPKKNTPATKGSEIPTKSQKDLPENFCEICNYKFAALHSFRLHCFRWHTTHECDMCNKKFRNKYLLGYHKKSCVVSESTELLNCAFCDRKFDTNSNLDEHLKIHENDILVI